MGTGIRTRKQSIMEGRGTRSMALLVALAAYYWVMISHLARADYGAPQPQGQVYIVGGDHLWPWPDTDRGSGNRQDYFQEWANNQTFAVNDTLYFGLQTLESRVAVVSSPDAFEQCDGSQGDYVQPNGTFYLLYKIAESGPFNFISLDLDLCKTGTRFNFTVPPPGAGPVPGAPGAPGNVDKDPDSPAGPGPAGKQKHGSGKTALIAGIGAVLAGIVIVAVVVSIAVVTRRRYWHRLRKASSGPRVKGNSMSYISNSPFYENKEEFVDVDMQRPWGPQRFSYNELKTATKSFSSSQVVGEGGFGTVYKGILKDSPGAPVAVKRLSQYARQGAREFVAEVNIISQLRHRNLVQLLGWCDEDEELILVYEYMPNGDLDDLIFGNYHHGEARDWTPLGWKRRYHIFCGVATALVYLHEEWEQRVVHRDVKTSNVMLDSHFNARLGDFGLARLSAHSQAPRTTLVAGTIGYLAPEFNLTGRATDKTDVYAFGVVILEVTSARRPLTSNCILVDWVWELHKEGKLLDAIDPQLQDVKSASDEEEMKVALQLGLLCCHPDPPSRPTMRHVLNVLQGESPLPKMPRSKPVAFFAEFG